MHRRYPLWILSSGVHIGSSFDELAREIGMLEKDRQAEGREAVIAEGTGERGIALQHIHDLLTIAERASLGERRLDAALDK